MKQILVLLLLLLASPAIADTTAIVSTFGNNTTGPSPQSLSLSAFMNDDHNLTMMATASDTKGVKSVSVLGNGHILATCLGATCMYVWDRTLMRAGWNTLEVRYVGNDNATHHAYGQIQQPPPMPTNFLFDNSNGYLLNNIGEKLLAK